MHRHAKESLVFVELFPREAFIGRLPDGTVRELYQDCLRLGKVGFLSDETFKLVLRSAASQCKYVPQREMPVRSRVELYISLVGQSQGGDAAHPWYTAF